MCEAVKVDRINAAVMTGRGFIKIRNWGLYSIQYYVESVDATNVLNMEVCSITVVTVASNIKPFHTDLVMCTIFGPLQLFYGRMLHFCLSRSPCLKTHKILLFL